MQIPILSGTFSEGADYRTSYPINMVPVPKATGISEGYLRPAEGIVELGVGPGMSRGGINWNGVLYRVMGTKLVSIDYRGSITEIGDVGGSGRVTFSYGFDYLAIASGGNLWLYDGETLAQNVDEDLGTVLDVVWVDGYYMTTDGEFLVVTELLDPFQVNPLKYGSSEADPDPVLALQTLRNEVYALNRYTIEVFTNTGGENFPFERVSGAQVEKGAVGTHANCRFMDRIAFIGGGKNEAPSIWLAANGTAEKLATREIDEILATYNELELSEAHIQERSHKGHINLIVYLSRHTLVFDAASTSATQTPVWYLLSSSITGKGRLAAESQIWCHDRWHVAHTENGKFGVLDSTVSTHWAETIGWQFGTNIVYNEGQGAIFHELELVGLTGNMAFGSNPTIWTQYSLDGSSWSAEKPISVGRTGHSTKRMVWFQQGHMRQRRMQRFRGTSDAHISVSRLEARLEPLAF